MKKTHDKGIIFNPYGRHNLECYTDGDLAGACTIYDGHEASSLLSRTGYLSVYSTCEILWVNKMQSQISLSTIKAEYISIISQCMKNIINMTSLTKEISMIVWLENKEPKINTTVFEENNEPLG